MGVYVPGTTETDPKKQNRSLQQLGGATEALQSSTASNTGAIATNTADIATNASAIATNTGNIATNTAAIATNAADIAAVEAAWTSYTPTLAPSLGAFTSASATGKYKQIGKTILFQLNISITTVGTAAGALILISLPVTANGSVSASGRETLVGGFAVAADGLSTTLRIAKYDNGSPIAAGAGITISGAYESV